MDIGNVIAAVVVLAVLGAVFGFILAVASKVFEVKKDPREEEILSHLAGANCGGCGFPGCAGCAAAILAGTAPVNACAPAGAENAAAIAKIMGQEAPSGERKVAFVRCNGGTNAAKRYEYVGVKDCLSATKVAGGPLECQFGCLGFGSCVSACQFGAMSIGPNGAAVVDPDKCTDCMACAKACPRHLITEVPVSKKVHVACANQDKGKAAMSVCTHSCIGCGLCQKECKKDAIHVVNGVAVIDYDKCVGCKLCTKVCPRDAILPIATAEEKEKYKAIKKAQAEKAAAAKAAETAGAAQYRRVSEKTIPAERAGIVFSQGDIHLVRLIDQNTGIPPGLAHLLIVRVIQEESLFRTGGIVNAPLCRTGIFLYVCKMGLDICLGHHKAAKADFPEIGRRKVLTPAWGDITALHDQILAVFNGGFDDLPHNRPQIGLQLLVILRREAGVAASDKSHFQKIHGETGTAVCLEKSLGQQGFACVRGAGNQKNHLRIASSPIRVAVILTHGPDCRKVCWKNGGNPCFFPRKSYNGQYLTGRVGTYVYIQCWRDGELLFGRKDRESAVCVPHPAAAYRDPFGLPLCGISEFRTAKTEGGFLCTHIPFPPTTGGTRPGRSGTFGSCCSPP